MSTGEKLRRLKERARIFSEVRRFFEERDFLELHTPTLVSNPGLEPHLIPFETRYVPQMGGGDPRSYYLPTSPEYHLKKALAWGAPRLFEIARSYRNGEKSARHEPEFFMLEWYRHPGDYRQIAADFKELLARLGSIWAPSDPWAKAEDMTVAEALRKHAGLDLRAALSGGSSLTEQARERGFASVNMDDDFETAFHKVLIEAVEPRLGFGGPCFLWDYPASLCALARVKPDDALYCERFEVYWRGIELANAFGELTDPVEQRRRCEQDQELRRRLYGTTPPLDEALFEALARLGPAGGIAVGLDRLVQTLLGAVRLQDVVAFPHADSL
jgi:lysyl-tRNA synthetase class 2